MDKRETRHQRRERWLQTLAFVGAIVVLSLVLYTALAIQRNRDRLVDELVPTVPAPPVSAAPAPTVRVQRRVLPGPYFAPNLVLAPVAWTRSTGAGVTIAATQNHDEDLTMLNLIAPDAVVQPLIVYRDLRVRAEPLVDLLQRREIPIVVITRLGEYEQESLLDTVSALTQAGVAVFVNADLAQEEGDTALLNDLEAAGAITVGRLHPSGRISWRNPDGQDLFERQINLFAPYGQASAMGQSAVLTAAGVAALVLEVQPGLSPDALKQHLQDTADTVYLRWRCFEPDRPCRDTFSVDPQTGDYVPTDRSRHILRVDAGRAVGVLLDLPWPLNAVNAADAWEMSTGRDVTVALIDHGFQRAAFQGQLVDARSFYGMGFSAALNHGSLIAKVVLTVAPDAALVFLDCEERHDAIDNTIAGYVAAFDYAIETRVDVILFNSQLVADDPEVHAAVERAIEAGIVVVWPSYSGHNDAVIRPGAFWDPRWQVGAFDRFIGEDWSSEEEGDQGVAAAQIAAVAALILEEEPDLPPDAVKGRILETAVPLSHGGYSLVDAAAAVANRPSGRQLAPAVLPGGRLQVVYQQAGLEQEIVVEIEERGRQWPVAAWPRRDILVYRAEIRPSALPSLFAFGAYGDDGFLLEGWIAEDLENLEGLGLQVALCPQGQESTCYGAVLAAHDAPSPQLDLDGDWLRLAWESPEGVPLTAIPEPPGGGSPSEYRLLRLEIEAPLLPDLVWSWY